MFWKEVEVILKNAGITKYPALHHLLQAWESFIIECEEGYEMSIYEYDNDLSIRGRIGLIVASSNLKKYPEYHLFLEEVKHLDERFKQLLSSIHVRADKPNWWEQGVLTNAGEEYMNDVKNLL